jgi:heme exporter protein A
MTAPTGLRLQARGLTLARGTRLLFRDLSFDLKSGQMLLLTGPNGSGKSSLLRALIGLAPLQSGTLNWTSGAQTAAQAAAQTAAPIAPALLRQVCLVLGHAAAVKAELSTLENLRLCAGLDRSAHSAPPDLEALLKALDQTGLTRQRDIETGRLSQGQKQRLQLARFALAVRSPQRPLWLMDEPSAALDTEGSAVLQHLLSRHLQGGGAAIVATHLALDIAHGETLSLPLGALPSKHAESAAWMR